MVRRAEIVFSMKETRIQVATARKNFAKVLARAAKKGERIKVVRYRTTLAGIVPGKDLDRLDECEDVMKGGASKKSKKKVSAAPRTRRARPTTRQSEKRTPTKAKTARK
jgi:antitoxin (DNA-binding transcriptional repressor) of toxin-antitoxin stability system